MEQAQGSPPAPPSAAPAADAPPALPPKPQGFGSPAYTGSPADPQGQRAGDALAGALAGVAGSGLPEAQQRLLMSVDVDYLHSFRWRAGWGGWLWGRVRAGRWLLGVSCGVPYASCRARWGVCIAPALLSAA